MPEFSLHTALYEQYKGNMFKTNKDDNLSTQMGKKIGRSRKI